MGVEIGSGHLLARLLSPACCPRFRKLKLRKLRFRLAGFQELLLLEAGTLSELSFEDMVEPGVLQLRTPNLRVLRINHSCLNELVISHAPRLEILMIDGLPDRIDVDGDLPPPSPQQANARCSTTVGTHVALLHLPPMSRRRLSATVVACCRSQADAWPQRAIKGERLSRWHSSTLAAYKSHPGQLSSTIPSLPSHLAPPLTFSLPESSSLLPESSSLLLHTKTRPLG
ncbi:hypothetical protein SETIT_7G237900v2 [Setaria italica]|uniref:FBD domain-containing protein n=1 Tax=Setaria italica TaxID=4555 RepID=A0A368RZA2_SETIT|nr:hypothetical protein SETIT_7G237900v2 [Setaria italica]